MTDQQAIVKNPLTIQKEAELKALQKKQKQLLKNLETEKAKLAQLKESIITTQRQTASTISVKMEAVQQLREELAELFKKAAKSKLFTCEEKRALKEIAREIGLEAPKRNGRTADAHNPFDDFTGDERQQEYQGAKSSHFFQEFAVKPEQQDGQQIRKLFLRLAARFHPDKARTSKEAERMHAIMQRINEAYQYGDIAGLLAIEAQYATDEPVTAENESSLLDIFINRINSLMRDIALLENQRQRVKEEIKNINRSDVGKIHKQFTGAYSPMQAMTQDMDQMIGALGELRDGIQTYLETGQMPESLARELHPPQVVEVSMDDVLDFLFEQMQHQPVRRRPAKRKAKTARKKKK